MQLQWWERIVSKLNSTNFCSDLFSGFYSQRSRRGELLGVLIVQYVSKLRPNNKGVVIAMPVCQRYSFQLQNAARNVQLVTLLEFRTMQRGLHEDFNTHSRCIIALLRGYVFIFSILLSPLAIITRLRLRLLLRRVSTRITEPRVYVGDRFK